MTAGGGGGTNFRFGIYLRVLCARRVTFAVRELWNTRPRTYDAQEQYACVSSNAKIVARRFLRDHALFGAVAER